MKFFIEFSDNERLVAMSSAGNAAVPVHKVFEYDLKKTLSIETHIANIHKSLIPLGYPIEDEPSLFCLQLSAALTTSETPVYFSFDPAVEALVMKSESKRPLLLFTLRPQVKAKRVAEVLRSMLSGTRFHASISIDGPSPAGRTVPHHSLKEEVFLLKNLLHDSDFAEKFIENGGIDVLLQVIETRTGNTLSYTLSALQVASSLPFGLSALMRHPSGLMKIYSLVASNVISVCRPALEIVARLCSMPQGFELIYPIALKPSPPSTSSSSSSSSSSSPSDDLGSKKPFGLVVQKLSMSGDLTTQLNSLKALTNITKSVPDLETKDKLLDVWCKLQLIPTLKSLQEIKEPAFKIELENFERSSGIKFSDPSYKHIPRHGAEKIAMLEEKIRKLQSELSSTVNLLEEEKEYAAKKRSSTSFSSASASSSPSPSGESPTTNPIFSTSPVIPSPTSPHSLSTAQVKQNIIDPPSPSPSPSSAPSDPTDSTSSSSSSSSSPSSAEDPKEKREEEIAERSESPLPVLVVKETTEIPPDSDSKKPSPELLLSPRERSMESNIQTLIKTLTFLAPELNIPNDAIEYLTVGNKFNARILYQALEKLFDPDLRARLEKALTQAPSQKAQQEEKEIEEEVNALQELLELLRKEISEIEFQKYELALDLDKLKRERDKAFEQTRKLQEAAGMIDTRKEKINSEIKVLEQRKNSLCVEAQIEEKRLEKIKSEKSLSSFFGLSGSSSSAPDPFAPPSSASVPPTAAEVEDEDLRAKVARLEKLVVSSMAQKQTMKTQLDAALLELASLKST